MVLQLYTISLLGYNGALNSEVVLNGEYQGPKKLQVGFSATYEEEMGLIKTGSVCIPVSCSIFKLIIFISSDIYRADISDFDVNVVKCLVVGELLTSPRAALTSF
jgi:hypothetical protein